MNDVADLAQQAFIAQSDMEQVCTLLQGVGKGVSFDGQIGEFDVKRNPELPIPQAILREWWEQLRKKRLKERIHLKLSWQFRSQKVKYIYIYTAITRK